MRRLIMGLIIGFFLGTMVIEAIAKYESSSDDAMSVVGYGVNSGAIYRIAVDVGGKLELAGN